MRRVGMMVIIVLMMVIVGCGGGSGVDKSSIESSSLCGDGNNAGNLKNQFGYFGGNTKFCKYTASRDWALIDANDANNILVMRLNDDGEYAVTDGEYIVSGDYGISYDKQTLKASNMHDISIIKVRENYYKREGYSAVDCYDISGGDREIIMCPNPKKYGKVLQKNINVGTTRNNNNFFGLVY